MEGLFHGPLCRKEGFLLRHICKTWTEEKLEVTIYIVNGRSTDTYMLWLKAPADRLNVGTETITAVMLGQNFPISCPVLWGLCNFINILQNLSFSKMARKLFVYYKSNYNEFLQNIKKNLNFENKQIPHH